MLTENPTHVTILLGISVLDKHICLYSVVFFFLGGGESFLTVYTPISVDLCVSI